jgi:hypothetical protein
MLGLDCWNGTLPQAQSFVSATGVTYPVLQRASLAPPDGGNVYVTYNTGYEAFFVVDGNGIIRYRKTTGTVPRWDPVGVGQAVDAALYALRTSVEARPAERRSTLQSPFPNPFNPTTTIPYELHGDGQTVVVSLRILDLQGRLVRSLVDWAQTSGQRYEAHWDGRDAAGQSVASGAYIAELTVDGDSQGRFLSLIK